MLLLSNTHTHTDIIPVLCCRLLSPFKHSSSRGTGVWREGAIVSGRSLRTNPILNAHFYKLLSYQLNTKPTLSRIGKAKGIHETSARWAVNTPTSFPVLCPGCPLPHTTSVLFFSFFCLFLFFTSVSVCMCVCVVLTTYTRFD